jgi:hypothetical protein
MDGLFDSDIPSFREHVTILFCTCYTSFPDAADYMKHGTFWGDDNRSDGEYILRLLWNMKAHYRIQKITSMDLILNQVNPVNTSTLNFRKLYFNILIPSAVLPSRFPIHSSFEYALLISPPATPFMLNTCKSLRFSRPNNIGEMQNLWSSSLCNSLKPRYLLLHNSECCSQHLDFRRWVNVLPLQQIKFHININQVKIRFSENSVINLEDY